MQASAGETVTGRSKVYWATGVWFNKSVLALKSPDTTHGVRMSVQGRANNFEGSAWHHYVKNMNMFVLPSKLQEYSNPRGQVVTPKLTGVNPHSSGTM